MVEEEVRKLIKDEFQRMKGCNHAKEIEFVKKAIKKEVGFLQRSSFLAYLFTQLHRRELLQGGGSDDQRAKARPVKPEKAKASPELFAKPSAAKPEDKPAVAERSACEQADSFSFWCNLKIYNKGKIDEFLRFIEKESGIPEGSAFDYRSLKSFSFFKIREPHALKVKERFAQPDNYNGMKVVVRPKGERGGDRK